jgi:hypothetical protein
MICEILSAQANSGFQSAAGLQSALAVASDRVATLVAPVFGTKPSVVQAATKTPFSRSHPNGCGED